MSRWSDAWWNTQTASAVEITIMGVRIFFFCAPDRCLACFYVNQWWFAGFLLKIRFRIFYMGGLKVFRGRNYPVERIKNTGLAAAVRANEQNELCGIRYVTDGEIGEPLEVLQLEFVDAHGFVLLMGCFTVY